MTRDQAYATALEEWNSMSWRERVTSLEKDDEDLLGDWLDILDKQDVHVKPIAFEKYLNLQGTTGWVPERAEILLEEWEEDGVHGAPFEDGE